MSFSACVINYNGAESLAGVIDSLMSQVPACGEIIVVDNGSSDGSADAVAEVYTSVRLVRLSDNRGPGAARNAAMRAAIYDRILIMDNDVALEPSCADRLSRALELHPSAAAAMPRVLYGHDPSTIQYDGASCHFLGLMTLEHPDAALEGAPSEIQVIGSLITCAFMVDRTRMHADASFDESFFIYFEDHDFGMRLRARGHDILSVPTAHCYHGQGTQGLSIRRTGRYSTGRVFYTIRNRWLFLLKNYTARSLVVLSPILLTYEVALLAVCLKKGWMGSWLRASASVLGSLPSVARSRRQVQGERVRPDRELLDGGPIPFRSELTAGRAERAAKELLDRLAAGYWRVVAGLV